MGQIPHKQKLLMLPGNGCYNDFFFFGGWKTSDFAVLKNNPYHMHKYYATMIVCKGEDSLCQKLTFLTTRKKLNPVSVTDQDAL